MKNLITICAVVAMLLTASADVKGVPVDTLLLPFDGIDGATTTVDSSPQHHSPINFFGNAQLDTAEKKMGSASLLLDGSDDYLTIPDSPDWDICASSTDDWTIDFWVRHNNYSSYQFYLHQYGSSGWCIVNEPSCGGLRFHSNGGPILPYGGKITDTDWHHIAFCKVADKYAMYKDEDQISYLQSGATANFAGPLYIGSDGYSNYSFGLSGSMDNLRITHNNLFGASPNASLTDTITYVSNPEPATVALLGLGALSLVRRKK